jgi:ABC-type phosphate transport system substrate-binding protein
MKCIGYLSVLVVAGVLTSSSQVAVIANKSVPVNSITVSKLSDIYLLNTQNWGGGVTVVPLWLRGIDDVEATFSAYLGMKPLDMRKIWLRVQLSGEGKAPLMFTSEEELIQKVINTRGAIGFVSEENVPGDVKVLAIIK